MTNSQQYFEYTEDVMDLLKNVSGASSKIEEYYKNFWADIETEMDKQVGHGVVGIHVQFIKCLFRQSE